MLFWLKICKRGIDILYHIKTVACAISGIILFSIFSFSCGILKYDEEDYPIEETVNEIWMIDLLTGTESFLANGQFPGFSPDGEHVLFIDNYRTIYSLNLQSRSLIRVSPQLKHLNSFSVSYQTDMIAFAGISFSANKYDLFIAHCDGNDFKNLTSSNFYDEYDPGFTADGSLIVYKEGASISAIDLEGKKTILQELNSSTASLPRLSFSKNKLLYIQHPDKTLKIIDLHDSHRDTVIQISGEFYDLSPVQDYVLYSLGSAYLLNLNTFEKQKLIEYARHARFSPDGNNIVYFDVWGNLVFFNILSQETKIIKQARVDVRIPALGISPDNDKVVYQKDYEIEVRP